MSTNRYQQYSSIAKDNLNGNFSFQGGETIATQTGTFNQGTGNGFASLLLGQADFASITIPFHQAQWLQDYYAVFAQDDFKVSNSLVLNLGIRYSIDRPRKEKYNDTSNFSTTAIDPHVGLPGALVFATNCTNCNKRWADTWFKDIAPRIGFAYTPSNSNGKTVFRGGFATLYAPLQYSDFGGDTRQGFTQTPQFGSNGFDPAFSIDNGFPAYTAGINTDPGQFDNGNANAPISFGNFVKPSYGRPGMLNQWNLQVQQEVAKDLILTIGYIGNAGAHLKSQEENINNMPIANFARGDALNSYDLAANGVPVPYAAYDPLNGGPTTTFNGNVQRALRPFPPVRLHRHRLLPPERRTLHLPRSRHLHRASLLPGAQPPGLLYLGQDHHQRRLHHQRHEWRQSGAEPLQLEESEVHLQSGHPTHPGHQLPLSAALRQGIDTS